MQVGDLVRCSSSYQYFGVITELNSTLDMAKIFWNDGKLSWIGLWKMDVINEV